QQAFAQWAENGKIIFDALLEVLGAVGTALSDMVTPDTVHDVVAFFGQLTNVLPVLGEVLSTLGALDVLTLIGQGFNQTANALKPVLPALQQFATTLGDEVSQLLYALQPALRAVGQLLGAFARTLGPVIEPLGGLLVEAISALLPLFH